MTMGFGPMAMAPEFYDFCTSKNNFDDKKAKLKARVKNKAIHNTASTVLLAAGAVGVYNVVKHPESKIVKKTGEYLTKAVNFMTGNCPETNKFIKDSVEGTKTYLKDHLGKTFKKSNGVVSTVKKWLSKGKNFVLSQFKFGDKALFKPFKKYLKEMATKFANVPAHYKASGLIALVTGVAVMAINNHKSYKNGKIDQYYEMKANKC